MECLDEMASAVSASLSTKHTFAAQTALWYRPDCNRRGEFGGYPSGELADAAVKMLKHEVKAKGIRKDMRPSVSPRDAMVLRMPLMLVLDISRAYARRHEIARMERLKES